MPEYEVISYRKESAAAWIMLNRPEVRNAINTTMIQELDRAVKDAEADAEVRAVVIGGAGPCFSAGHDLKIYAVEEGGLFRGKSAEARWAWEYEMYMRKSLVIWELEKPVIAMVHGHCVAAGLMLANMCDVIVAADDALFADPVGRMGLASTEVFTLAHVVGVRKAKELMLTGRRFGAREAMDWGMVNQVVPRGELESTVQEMVRMMAATEPFAAKMTKLSLNMFAEASGFRTALMGHFLAHQLTHASEEGTRWLDPDARRGAVKDFLKRRDTDKLGEA